MVDVSLRNNGPVDASFPFFCITSLGLTVEPALNWVQREIKLVRKMKRFSSMDNSVLETHGEVDCCTVALKCNYLSDGFLEFEYGSRHSLGSLPDLNLVCVVGAGNFPSSRVLLEVPGMEIKKAIPLPNAAALDYSMGLAQKVTAYSQFSD